MKRVMKNVLSGVVIGSSMLIPGVSGGTTAILLGVYDRLIAAVSGFRKAPAKNGLFLLEVALGGGLGAVLLARAVLAVTNAWYFPMRYLFMGLIAGGVPLLFRQAGLTRKRLPLLLFAAAGAAAAIGVEKLPLPEQGFGGVPGLLVGGMLIAVALVLPGISTSHLLLAMGLYEPVLEAVQSLNLPYLSLLLSGTLAGIFLSAKLLETAMRRFPAPCYLMIAGFVSASVYSVHPGVPSGGDILPCLFTFCAGFTAMVMISLRPMRKTREI